MNVWVLATSNEFDEWRVEGVFPTYRAAMAWWLLQNNSYRDVYVTNHRLVGRVELT